MSKLIDLTRTRYNRLVVIERAPGIKTKWRCQCDCGNIIIATSYDLRRHHTKSCGCIRVELGSNLHRTHGHRSTEGNDIPEYWIWRGIITRCYYNNEAIKNASYRDRGIEVCQRWLGDNGFEHFLADMGPRPSKKYSIDRRNNDLGYSPSNCYWATAEQQNNNRRNVKYYTFNGETLSRTQWARKVGLREATLYRRLTIAKWPLERALTTPLIRGRQSKTSLAANTPSIPSS